jgi:hypothetical protein
MIALGVMPLVLAGYYVGFVVPPGSLGVDFREAFVYPPLVALVLAPFGLLPVGVATAIALAATGVALVATLWVLDVRDWRCYGVALASPAVLAAIQTASLSPLLALAIAVAWKRRAHGWSAPALICAVIVAKLFLWPLLVWLAVVRGVRCASLTAVAAAALVVAPWAVGFPGARSYPHLLSLMTDLEGAHAYTPRALALSLGAGTTLAEAVAIVAGGLVLAAAVAVRGRELADQRSLALALLAALLLSPLVWAHYVVVLLPALAIAHRRVSAGWFALWGLWFAGGTWTEPSAPQIAVSLVVMLLVTLGALQLSLAAGPRARPRAGGRSAIAGVGELAAVE